MIRGEKLTAVIPVRSGSKGIPNKNLYKIDNETLVERAIRLAKNSEKVDQIFVTTDDPEIFEIAKKLNATPPNLRPAELATDSALTIDAVKHVLQDAGITSGYVLLLQVTTPLRTLEDLSNYLAEFENNSDADAIVSVVEHSAPHPVKLLKKDGHFITPYIGKNPSVPRQQLETVYALNGAFYLTSLSIILTESTFLPEKTLAFEMPAERSINLDHPLDLVLLEALLEKTD